MQSVHQTESQGLEYMKTSLNSVQEIIAQWEVRISASKSEKLAVHMGRGSTPLASKKCEGSATLSYPGEAQWRGCWD